MADAAKCEGEAAPTADSRCEDVKLKTEVKRCPKCTVDRWQMTRFGMWVFLVFLITFTPIMMRASYVSVRTRKVEGDKYAAPTVHCQAFLISIVIGCTISLIAYGKKGLRDCFAIRPVLWQVPVSFGYAGSEAFALLAMRTADPIMYAVIHKMRLLETAMMTRFFLKRRVTSLQWCICFTVTACVLAFVLNAVAENKAKKDVLGPILLLLNITISVACSIYADWVYKKIGYPLPIQMAQGRLSAALGSALIAIIFISVKGWWRYGWYGGPGGGWDGFTVMLMCWNIVRDWTTCFVLLHLDALWKALAGSTAVATTYVADVIMLGKSIVLTRVALVLAIMFSVSIYALVKHLEKKYDALRKQYCEMEGRIASLELGETDAWKIKV